MFAALFPGQGSQYVGMGKTLCAEFALAKRLLEEAEDILRFSLSEVMFEGPKEQLQNTFYAQPALFFLSMAAFRVLESEHDLSGIAFFAGHSLGEYSALCAAGVISFRDALSLIMQRASAMSKVTGGGMLASIGLPREDIEKFLPKEVVIANDNSLVQLVLSGPLNLLEICADQIKFLGGRAIFLHVSGPFHSPFMQSAQAFLEPLILSTPFHAPKRPIITNVSALAQEDPQVIQRHLIEQISGTLLWTQTQIFLAQQGIQNFLEIGPGSVLAGLLRKTLPMASCVPIEKPSDIRSFGCSGETPFISLAGK